MSILFEIGKTIGDAIRKNTGKKNYVEVLYDQLNGNPDADGIEEPTNSFVKAIFSAASYFISDLKITSVTSEIIINDFYAIQHQQYIKISNISESEAILLFNKNTEGELFKLWVNNSTVEFSNITFMIPDDVIDEGTFDTKYTPIIGTHSTIIFKNCKFKYNNTSATMAFIGAINSTIYIDSCYFEGGEFTFIYGINKLPNLFIQYNIYDSNITGNVQLKDPDTLWINYG